MRVLRLILSGTSLLACVSAQTVISQSVIVDAAGNLASGWIRIWAATPFVTAGGVYVSTAQTTIPIINGAFSVALWPNDTSTPSNTYYYARFQLNDAAPRLQLWYIPTCSVPLDVAQIQAVVSVTAGVMTVTGNSCPAPANLTFNQETGSWNSTSGTWASQ